MLSAAVAPKMSVSPALMIEEADEALVLFRRSNSDPDLPGVYEITAPGIQACQDIIDFAEEINGEIAPDQLDHLKRRHAVIVATIAALSEYICARDARAKGRLH